MINIALLFGGRSVEHEVSVISALQAAANFDPEKYDVTPVYIDKHVGMWFGHEAGNIRAYGDIPALLSRLRPVTIACNNGKFFLMRNSSAILGRRIIKEIHFAFPVVHGANAEDGTVQGWLNMLGIPYAGSDVGASAASMNKLTTKLILKNAGIPVLDGKVVSSVDWSADPKAALQNVVFPAVVKPVNLGSSVGITKVSDSEGFGDAMETALAYTDTVIIEPAVQNLQEINCAVLGDTDEAIASECEEPVGADEILSYRDKYMSGDKTGKAGDSGLKHGGLSGAKRRCPADVSDGKRDMIRWYAVRAFKALGCAGVARVDFLTDRETGNVWANEVNPIPGSLSHYLFEAGGLEYKELLDKIVGLGFKRWRGNQRLITSFDTNLLTGKASGLNGQKFIK